MLMLILQVLGEDIGCLETHHEKFVLELMEASGHHLVTGNRDPHSHGNKTTALAVHCNTSCTLQH